MRRRLALARKLGGVERALAERDEGDSLGEHERDEKVVAAGELAHHDERAHRNVGDAAIEGAHSDEREGARIDARIAEQSGERAPERAAEETSHHERRAEVSRAAAGS